MLREMGGLGGCGGGRREVSPAFGIRGNARS